MNWYPIIGGVLACIVVVVTLRLLPKKWNTEIRGLISVLVVLALVLIIRLIFGTL